MAHQSAVCRMIGHGNTAVRTGHNLAARSARDKGIISAAVYQHYRLLAVRTIFVQLLYKLAAQLAVFRLLFVAHINGNDLRKHRFAVSVFQLIERILAALCRGERLDARRSGCEQSQAFMPCGTVSRHAFGVVARSLLRFICMLLLFVDYYKSDIFKRRKNRRTGAYNYFCIAVLDALPLVRPFSGGQRAVKNRNAVIVSRMKHRKRLRGQRYFRHHNYNRLIICKNRIYKLQIN